MSLILNASKYVIVEIFVSAYSMVFYRGNVSSKQTEMAECNGSHDDGLDSRPSSLTALSLTERDSMIENKCTQNGSTWALFSN